MGYNDRDYYRESAPDGSYGVNSMSMVVRLIIVNVAVYLLDYILRAPTSDGGVFRLMHDWLAVSGETLRRPLLWYQLLTAGFSHSSELRHIVFNMFALYMFGSLIERRLGSMEFLRFYLVAIVLGNLLFAARAMFMEAPIYCLGASGGVSAIVVLCCWYYPKEKVYLYGLIAMPLWLLGILMIGLDMYGAIGSNDGVAHDVHLAGATFALLYGALHWNLGWIALPGRVRRWMEDKRWIARGSRRGNPSLQIHRGEEEEDAPSYFKPSFSLHTGGQDDEEDDDADEKRRNLDSQKQAEYDRLLSEDSAHRHR